MSCSCTGNCDLIDINNLVLSDTFHTWYDRTNEIIDAINPIQVYDVNVGATDGGLTAQSTCVGGNSNGVITLKVQPGPGIGVGTTVTPNYYLNHTMIDVSNMSTKGATGFDEATIANRPSEAFPDAADWYIVSDASDGTLGSGAGTPKRVKAQQVLPQTVYLPNGFQFNGDISINGNLSVQGTQSNVDSNDLRIEDKILELAYHRLVQIDVTGPTAVDFPAQGATFYYYDPGVGNTAAYTTVGQISEVNFNGAQTTLKLHKFSAGGVNDIVSGGRLSITGSIFDFTMSAGPTTTEALYTDSQLDESGIVVRGSDSDKQFLWVYNQGPDSVIYNSFVTNTNLGVSGDSNAVISSQFKSFGYGSSNQNNNKFQFVGHNGAAPTIRLGGLGTGSDEYGYWGITRQNYGLTGSQQPLVFSFKPYAATGEITSFTIWSGASGSTFSGITATNFAQGFNSDQLDGAHGTTVPTAWSIPIALGGGKLDPGWVDTTSISKCYTIANHGFVVGDVVRLNPNNGSLTGAIATSVENAEVLGIVNSVADSNNLCLTTKGFITGLTGLAGSNIVSILPLVTGHAYFLSPDNQGRMIANPDSGAGALALGEVRKPIMVAMGPDSAYVHNYLGVVEGTETDIIDVQGLNPVGMVMPFSGSLTNIPDGWMVCDGARLEKALWPELFGAIGNNYFADGTVSPSWVSGNVPVIMIGGTRGLQVNDAVTIEATYDGRDYTYNTYVTAVNVGSGIVTFAAFAAGEVGGTQLRIRGRIDTGLPSRTNIFFLPDMRRRVIIGATIGLTGGLTPSVGVGDIGGKNEQYLTTENIPPHSHRLTNKGDYNQLGGGVGGFGSEFESDNPSQGNYFTALGPVGVAAATAFDNMQEFVAVHWIIRARKGLSAMILSGHNHDDRYIRYDGSQTVSSLNRATFRNNAKVLRNDGDDTFSGHLSVTGNVNSNLRVNAASLNITGGAVVGGSLTGGDAYFSGDVEVNTPSMFIGNGTVPMGGIIMWSGSAVPTGWALCDGSTVNGTVTPDLRGKFILGGSSYSTSRWRENITSNNTAQGGSKDSIVVDHFHQQFANVDDPTPVGNVDLLPNQYVAATQSGGGSDLAYALKKTTTEATLGRGESVGSSGTNANLPPYYVLAFIMRVY